MAKKQCIKVIVKSKESSGDALKKRISENYGDIIAQRITEAGLSRQSVLQIAKEVRQVSNFFDIEMLR